RPPRTPQAPLGGAWGVRAAPLGALLCLLAMALGTPPIAAAQDAAPSVEPIYRELLEDGPVDVELTVYPVDPPRREGAGLRITRTDTRRTELLDVELPQFLFQQQEAPMVAASWIEVRGAEPLLEMHIGVRTDDGDDVEYVVV